MGAAPKSSPQPGLSPKDSPHAFNAIRYAHDGLPLTLGSRVDWRQFARRSSPKP